jgi:hypothetical protein
MRKNKKGESIKNKTTQLVYADNLKRIVGRITVTSSPTGSISPKMLRSSALKD